MLPARARTYTFTHSQQRVGGLPRRQTCMVERGTNMNVLDFVIIAMVGVMIGAGFFLGVSRVTASIVAIYFAAIVSATFYQSIATSLEDLVSAMNPSTAELLSFVLLFLTMTILFAFMIMHSLKSSNMAGRFAILDNVGGATLGIVIAGVAVALAITVTTLMLQVLTSTTTGSQDGMLGAVQSQVSGSALVPVFQKLLPILTSSIRPWFPGGLPDILTSTHPV
jgi:uncharacterized membrane protein required for colicin V production